MRHTCTVSDLQLLDSRDIIGLQLAFEVSERNAAFFWIGDLSYSSKHSMLGLWSVGTAPLSLNLHIAFEVAAIEDLLDAPKLPKDQGITPLSFVGTESMELSMIGWMPAAAIYFRDPDGHLLEYLTMVDDKERRPDLGIISCSEWIANNKQIG